MDKHKELFGWITAGISNASAVAVQTNAIDELLQTATLAVGLIAGALSIAYTVYKWYKHATSPTSDGGKNITLKEVEEGIEDLVEVTKRVNKNK